jgi:hypothetical protein
MGSKETNGATPLILRLVQRNPTTFSDWQKRMSDPSLTFNRRLLAEKPLLTKGILQRQVG